MAYESHQRAAASISARCAVITLSDTRTEETDKSGQAIRQLLQGAGHAIALYRILPDDPAALEALLRQCLSDVAVDCILTNGGTGISPRDQTIPTIERLLAAPLAGFGELFRMLSYEQIGSGAMLSRATAGIAAEGNKPIFAMPGSTRAVELAMTKLILPELGHVLAELRKR
jgi:molybdenum cofactor biosynthesis protein B